MIHIDRNHHASPLSPNSKQNNALIDHHKILSWSHDDSFTAVTGVQQNPAPNANVNANLNANPNANSTSKAHVPGPVTPVDPHEPTASHTSSSASPADGNTASPTRDRSSSLSPAPETGSATGSSPAPVHEQEAPVEKALKQEEEEEDEGGGGGREGEQLVVDADDAVSPLSELSPPPPDQDEEEAAAQASKPAENGKGGADVMLKGAESAKGGEVAMSARVDSNPDDKATSKIMSASSSAHRLQSPPNQSSGPAIINSPVTPIPKSPSHINANDPKVVSVLELNMELLKVCMEFQSRGFPVSEMRFSQYSSRLQSNLTWLAAAADHSRVGNHNNMQLPTMDPPPSIEFAPATAKRIAQLYAELPTIFGKEIARQHRLPTFAPPMPPVTTMHANNLKRERGDEGMGISDLGAAKRRHTGDSIITKGASMPPPPSIPTGNMNPTMNMNVSSPMQHQHTGSSQFSLPMSNGPPSMPPTQNQTAPHPQPLSIPQNPSQQAQMSSPRLSEAQLTSLGPGLNVNTAEAQLAAANRERARQAQIRAAQAQAQQRQGGGMGQGMGVGGGMSGMQSMGGMNAAAGPSGLSSGGGGGGPGGGGGANPNINVNVQQQMFQILQNPGHAFYQYMTRMVPGFQGLPVPQQMQKMMMAQNSLQRQQQEHQHQQHQNQGQTQQLQQQQLQAIASKNPMQQQMHHQQQQMATHNNPPGPSMSSVPFAGLGSSSGNPASPVPPQSPMFGGGNGMDGVSGGGIGGSGGGGMGGPIGGSGMGGGMGPSGPGGMNTGMGLPGGFNMNNLSPHQRQQLMLMQQQSRFSGGATQGAGQGQGQGQGQGINPAMMMNNPNAYAQREQQRMGMAQAGSPTHPGSPMPSDGGFPTLRSNPSTGAIPGIARSARSPSDGVPSPNTPRRGGSMGQEDYQRMIQQQTMQAQAQRALSARSPPSSAGYGGPGQQGMGGGGGGSGSGSGWQQQQQQHHMAAQQQQQQAGPSLYGMSPPGSAGSHSFGGGPGQIMNAPSPSNSQSWAQQGQGQGQGGYPFTPSPGGVPHQSASTDHGMQRHMSGTPAPQQQMHNQNQHQGLNHASPGAGQLGDGTMASDFDLFNWGP